MPWTYCPHGVNTRSACAQCITEGVVTQPDGLSADQREYLESAVRREYLESAVRRQSRLWNALRQQLTLREYTRPDGTRDVRYERLLQGICQYATSQPSPAAPPRSNAMPDYLPSRDPLVPGTGRPLQMGDIVAHRAGESGTRAIVNGVRIGGSDGRQIIRVDIAPASEQALRSPRGSVEIPRSDTHRRMTNPSCPSITDPYGFGGSGFGYWLDSDWILVRRPSLHANETAQPMAPTPPRSLDPDVPSESLVFQVNDIVVHVWDKPEGPHARVVGLRSDGMLSLQSLSAQAEHLSRVWNPGQFRLVRRPKPHEYSMFPPARPELGTAGEWVDPEFVDGLVAWVEATQQASSTILNDSIPGLVLAGASRGQRVTPDNAIFSFRLFFSPEYESTHQLNPLFSSAYSAFGVVPRVINQLKGWLNQVLTRYLNELDPTTSRCQTCAADGKRNLHNSPECAHFVCAECGVQRTTECLVCSRLFREEPDTYGAGNARCCMGCCSHITIKEGEIEEIMLSKNRCQACKKGKACKCPGCEQPKCKVKQTKVCCGHCTDHCDCDRYIMHHTGMKPLVKFPAPEGEKGMTRLLGTEIETYGRKGNYSPLLRKAVKAWQASVITDGSIGDKGVEMVTQPAGGSQWRQMIADFGAGFKESGMYTKHTCGLHMHVDCTDVDAFALKRIIKLYAHTEWCFYDAITLKRLDGGYSKPNGKRLLKWLDNDCAKFDAKMEAGEAKRRLSYLQYGFVGGDSHARLLNFPKPGEPYVDSLGNRVVHTESTIKTLTSQWDESVLQRVRSKGDTNRYSGLNMHSYWLRGTLEFRHHHGTNDPEKIVNWGYVCGSLVDYCVKHDDADVDMLVAQDPRLVMGILLEEAGSPQTYSWLETRWEKFTTGPNKRKSEPLPDGMGEV